MLPPRCLPEPMCSGWLGREVSPVRGNLKFRIHSRGVGLRSGLGDEGEWPRARRAAPLGAVRRAGRLDGSCRVSICPSERGGCEEVRAAGIHSLRESPHPNILFQSVPTRPGTRLSVRKNLGVVIAIIRWGLGTLPLALCDGDTRARGGLRAQRCADSSS